MAKQKAQPIEPTEVKSAAEAREEMDAKYSALNTLEAERERLLEPFAAELPATTELLMVETKFFLAQGAVATIEIGRRLIVLKEQAAHGEWLDILNELNISQPTASRSMRVAQKFGNLKSMLHLDPTKLIALLDVPDEELKHIDKKGVLGMEVDAIHAMTTRQLRDKLRAERAKTDKGAEQLRRRDEALRDKDAQIKALKVGPRTDLEFMEECSEIQMRLAVEFGRLRAMYVKARSETQHRSLLGTIVHIEKDITLASYEMRENLDPTNEDTPADRQWIEQMEDGVNWHAPHVIEFLSKASGETEKE